MTEAERVFQQTSRELKVTARSARYKVRGGGRVVCMPSDSMSRKEREAMNGDVRSYELGKPMGYEDFKAMPNDIQQMYLDKVVGMFPNVPNAMIAEMFGVPSNTFSPFLKRNKLVVHRYDGWRKIPEGEAFVAWACGEKPSVPVEEPMPVVDGDVIDDAVEPPVPSRAGVSCDKIDINNIAVLLSSLAGTGAKLTIEIVL